MSYWSVGLPQDSGDTHSNMEQQSGPGEEMGAKVSLVDGMGHGSALVPSLTLENIQAAYEDGKEGAARELIQQASCVECSAGTPHIDGNPSFPGVSRDLAYFCLCQCNRLGC